MSVDCGCGCTSGPGVTGNPPANRPGLPRLDVRRGTFATFRRTLLDEISRTPELAGLHTRLSSDHTVTLLELWSAVADVIAFYHERTANEAYLTTATTRDSVLRLVRLLDYQVAPGLAATTLLSFALEPGKKATIPVGTRVQSVPAQGAQPQKYETLEAVEARGSLDAARIRPLPVAYAPTAQGSATAIASPDPDALEQAMALSAGDDVALYSPFAWEVRTVESVETDDETAVVSWDRPITGSTYVFAAGAFDVDAGARRVGRAYRLFGHTAPRQAVVTLRKVATDATTTFLAVATTSYALTTTATTTTLLLDDPAAKLAPGAMVLVVSEQSAGTTTIPFVVTAVAGAVGSLPSSFPPGTELPTGFTPPAAPPVATGKGTRVTLAPVGTRSLSTLNGADLRGVQVVELTGGALRFWPYRYPSRVTGDTAFVAGRRSGWSRIEVGRRIAKGHYVPGVDLEPSMLELGRRVIAVDASGRPAAGRVASARILGGQVTMGPSATDPVTVAMLGLDPAQATPVTVLASAYLGNGVTLEPRRRLSLRIAGQPPATVTLPPTLASSPSLTDVATALQAAVRAARPESPAYARATVWTHWFDALVVSAGLPGAELEFGPADDDGTTVERLGLAPAQVRYLDGLLSAPVEGLVGTPVTGSFTIALGLDGPATLSINTTPTDVPALATALSGVIGAVAPATGSAPPEARPTDDGRLLVIPAPPPRELWSWLAVRLDDAQSLDLDATSARLLGNVAAASHGETVRDEVLGDGDASVAFQRFTLRKKPVTLLPGSGGVADSSLTVRVGGVAWTEVPTLYGHTPSEQVYVTRVADDGSTTVHFGDGAMGARPLTGHDNVAATYRQGLGVAGRVPAHSLTNLLDRPSGVKKVDNPIAADGGLDPEPPERTRVAAPGTVRTFGRAVSLRDFEDGLLTQGMVAKARADWVWDGHRRLVHLTVAGEGGSAFSPSGLATIASILDSERDVNRPLLLGGYNPVALRIRARVVIDPAYVVDDVLAQVRSAVVEAFSFERQRFAAAMHLSDVYAVMHCGPGVVGVDIDVLDVKRTDAAFRAQHGVDDTLPEPSNRILVLPAYWSDAVQAVIPAELACLEDPALDLVLTASGGDAS